MKTATIRNNVTVKESNQERIAFAQTIDFQPLFDHTCSFSKVNCEFSTPIIEVNRAGDVYISFKSEDIASQTGPFAAILKECRFENFVRKSVNFNIHLSGCDTVFCSGHLEIHIAQMIFIAKDIR